MDDTPGSPPVDTTAQLADMASELQDIGISNDMRALLERGIHSTKLPKPLRSARAAEAMQQVFEVIGGVPRLALWADKNPDKFYALYARMIPQTIAPVLPEEAPDKKKDEMPWLSARRLMYQEAMVLAEDIASKPTNVTPLKKLSNGS